MSLFAQKSKIAWHPDPIAVRCVYYSPFIHSRSLLMSEHFMKRIVTRLKEIRTHSAQPPRVIVDGDHVVVEGPYENPLPKDFASSGYITDDTPARRRKHVPADRTLATADCP